MKTAVSAGEVEPHQTLGYGLNDEMKSSMMKSRASRLIKTPNGLGKRSSRRMCTTKGRGQRQGRSKLSLRSIAVKELVSTGPGVCSRIYRMTIETNGAKSWNYRFIQ